MQAFSLKIEPQGQELAMEVSERPTRGSEPSLFEERPLRVVAKLHGFALNEVLEVVRAWLRKLGVSNSQLRPRAPSVLEVDEETGVRMALLFRAVSPLKKVDRIEAIGHGIARMPREEVLYWYGKVSNGFGEQAVQALRILLAGEQRAKGAGHE
ncbi:MAG: hypothetical protein AMXMBFR33_17590 [Candidatus Xenobia bacterium]